MLKHAKLAVALPSPASGAITITSTGAVLVRHLAWVSSPSYDPNRFITRFSPEEWLSIISDTARPLEIGRAHV